MKIMEMRAWNIKEKRWATMEELLGEIPVSATVRPPSILTCGGDDWIINLFTGLRDSKRTPKYPEGQEIYEGDNILNGKYLSVVKFGEYRDPGEDKRGGHIGFYVDFYLKEHNETLRKDLGYWAKVSEVVGNIYNKNES